MKVEVQSGHSESDNAMFIAKYLQPVRIKRRSVLTDVTIYYFANSRVRLGPGRATKRFNNVSHIVILEKRVHKTVKGGNSHQKRTNLQQLVDATNEHVKSKDGKKSCDRKNVECEGDFIPLEITDELIIAEKPSMTNLPVVKKKHKKKAKNKKDLTTNRTSNKMIKCSSKTPSREIKDKLGLQKLLQQMNCFNGVVKCENGKIPWNVVKPSIVQQTTNIASVPSVEQKRQNFKELNNNEDLRINSTCSSEQMLANNLRQEKLWEEQMERNYSTIKYECGSVYQQIINIVPVEPVSVETSPVTSPCENYESIYRKFRHVEKREWMNFECHLVLTSVLKRKG